MNWKHLLACIYVPTGDGSGVYGTGIPVRRDLLLTARHVVAPADRKLDLRIRVNWWYSRMPGYEAFFELEPGADPIVWQSETYDAALLRCPHPPGCDRVNRWLALRRERPSDEMRWTSEGFPAVADIGDMPNPGSFGGRVYSRADDEPWFEVQSDIAPEDDLDWQGASGMPVVVEGKVLGFVRQVPRGVRGAKLHVTPVWKLWEEEPEFRASVQTEQFDRHRECLLKNIREVIGRSDELVIALAGKLDGAIVQAAGHQRPDLVAAALADGRLRDVLEAIFQVSKELPEAQHARALATAVAPALIPFQEVVWLLEERKAARASYFSIPAGSYTMAEVFAAAVEGRAADFVSPRDEELPPGKKWLPITPTVECGSNDSGEKIAKAILHDVEQRFLGDLVPAVQGQIIERLYSRSPGAPEQSASTKQRIVKKKLERFERLGEPCPYLAFYLPADVDERLCIETAAAAIRREYPQLMILLLDIEHEEADQDSLGGLQMLLSSNV